MSENCENVCHYSEVNLSETRESLNCLNAEYIRIYPEFVVNEGHTHTSLYPIDELLYYQ